MAEHVWPPLPLASWHASKDTLHRFAQIVGKVRMELAPAQNHWWHVPLYVAPRGLTTEEIYTQGVAFEVTLDLVDHRLRLVSSEGPERSFPLAGTSVRRFYEQLMDALSSVGVSVDILAVPYDLEDPVPFFRDERHATYDPEAVRRFFRVLLEVDHVLKVFRGHFLGKTSPVHFFWHSFDLALSRFSGRPGSRPTGDLVTDEAYFEEVISFGFWPGDSTFPEPAFYSYTAPEPAGLTLEPLEPHGAMWLLRERGSLAVLPYESVRTRARADEAVLDFLESAYLAGARLTGWDIDALAAHPPQTGRRRDRRRPEPHREMPSAP